MMARHAPVRHWVLATGKAMKYSFFAACAGLLVGSLSIAVLWWSMVNSWPFNEPPYPVAPTIVEMLMAVHTQAVPFYAWTIWVGFMVFLKLGLDYRRTDKAAANV